MAGSPRDSDGHGTHTSRDSDGHGAARVRCSTKVCWVSWCFSSDILKATEVAVTNGVDVLSLSLGGGKTEYSSRDEGRGRIDISRALLTHIHAGVRGWRAMRANMIFSYDFSVCANENVLTSVKMLFEEVPFVITLKS